MASLKTLSATSMPPSRKMAPSSASKQLAIACLQKKKTESSTSISRVSDPDSIRFVDPYPDLESGSGVRRAKNECPQK
jgi:hypothetical protein